MKSIFRSPFFWISASVVSGLLILFSFNFFQRAFPIVQIDITMNRKQALDSAKAIAQRFDLGPENPQQAASFFTDTIVKTFVELEGGGKDVLADMMKQELYQPYTWQIRLFKEFEKNEAIILFTPDGKPYGFVETISEDTPGPNLESSQAQTIAEQAAINNWHIDLTAYKLVETAKEVRPSKRSDHTFVYERPERIGEGYYRLCLVVSGDKLTQLTHFVKIPEAFLRRYQEMRSANESIAWAANLAMQLLYFICGCTIGLFLLIRKRWAILQTPLLWGIGIALLMVLTQLNQLPLLWMHYNTAHTTQGFLLQQLVSSLFAFLIQAFFFTIVFATAEGLTRKAFDHHPQLWKLWSTKSASSFAVLGRTLGGYLLIGFDFAFVILFYFFTTHFMGWWIPSEALFNPNVLATYFPWLSSIAISLNAAFVEECLFRAIPLAGAALLGKRFGKQKLWIIAAFILQAIIFGAAHANYPAQPAYARLIELVIPSCAWAYIYLRFGLLPTIISHFVYDVIWFSLPIFVSSAPQAWTNRIMVIAFALVPLWIVLFAWIKQRKLGELPDNVLNAAWQPEEQITTPPQKIFKKATEQTLNATTKKVILGCGLIGLLAWIIFTPFSQDAPSLTTTSRNQVITQAQHHLQKQGVTLNHPWQPLVSAFHHYQSNRAIELQHRFIWQHGGKDMYQQLLGTYLTPPHWVIRFAQFEGDIIARAEEYHLFMLNGIVFEQNHILPEVQPGAQLNETQARSIAHQTLKEQFKLDPSTLEEISAVAKQQPNRKDWTLTFSNPHVYQLEKGQARIGITIAGDHVVLTFRYIHVPEEWDRAEQNRQNLADILKRLCLLIFIITLVAGSTIALRRWTQNTFSTKTFTISFVSLLILFAFNAINAWPSIVSLFNTSAPFLNQAFQMITAIGLQHLILAALLALTFTFIADFRTPRKLAKTQMTYILGIGVGTFVAGFNALAHRLFPSTQPLWANYTALGTYLPLNAVINNFAFQYVSLTLVFLLCCAIIDQVTSHWHKRQFIALLLFIIFGLTLSGIASLNDISIWLFSGSAIGVMLFSVYHLIIRFDHALIPIVTGSYMILQAIQQGLFSAYPGTMLTATANIAVTTLLAIFWFKRLNR